MKTEPIYKIFDKKDNGYSPWYGTAEDIIEYLSDEGLKLDEGWVVALGYIGLTFKELNC
ncbi:MAG: hypothetical protein M0R17_07300 [Candidatus Omnitrophica bacterium]|nr:hypothetical protein [Candidatus Omnitrophota bacterium]